MAQKDILFKLKEKENVLAITFSNEGDSLGVSILEDD